jgi:hypothetical protein
VACGEWNRSKLFCDGRGDSIDYDVIEHRLMTADIELNEADEQEERRSVIKRFSEQVDDEDWGAAAATPPSSSCQQRKKLAQLTNYHLPPPTAEDNEYDAANHGDDSLILGTPHYGCLLIKSSSVGLTTSLSF